MEDRRPKPWKMTLLTWLCIYPLINLVFFTLMPLVGEWPVPLRTLAVSLVLVPLMRVVMLFMQARLSGWLHR